MRYQQGQREVAFASILSYAVILWAVAFVSILSYRSCCVYRAGLCREQSAVQHVTSDCAEPQYCCRYSGVAVMIAVNG